VGNWLRAIAGPCAHLHQHGDGLRAASRTAAVRVLSAVRSAIRRSEWMTTTINISLTGTDAKTQPISQLPSRDKHEGEGS